jgi:hypothetical protein
MVKMVCGQERFRAVAEWRPRWESRGRQRHKPVERIHSDPAPLPDARYLLSTWRQSLTHAAYWEFHLEKVS